MATATDPLQAVRRQIEDIAGDQELDPTERALKLQHFSDELTDLQGSVTSYLADAQLGQEAQTSVAMQSKLRARQNATIREHLVGRGLATHEQMDAMGYLSHGDLDRLQEEGLLEAMLEEIGWVDAAREELKAKVEGASLDVDEILRELQGASGGWVPAMITNLVESHGYELEGEPAAGEALVLQRIEEGRADRIVVTFSEGGDVLTVDSVARN